MISVKKKINSAVKPLKHQLLSLCLWVDNKEAIIFLNVKQIINLHSRSGQNHPASQVVQLVDEPPL